ncbi:MULTISPECIES: protein kinase [unclassified Streptomyces]|uniref:serine/threonine-protein kinase n=1 Tax=unclassified Streptomyces TaxID=2593676 RepID=UPI0036E258D1
MGTPGDNFRVIAGRYRLEVRLGRGGMGVVWQATDLLLGRRVAVKELPLDEPLSEAGDRRRRDRVLREARAVSQLRHPHIVVVHDVVEHDERPYLVLELIDGSSLADRIAEHGPVVPAEAARIGVALLGALRAAHAAGVLHRDIKPANVLLETGTGRVVLTDFGVAQVAGTPTLTELDSFVGSPEYTAPERMSGLPTGPASDLWSLGVLLCTAVSGASPFRRDSLSGVLHAVLAAEIRPPAQAAPILPVVRGLLERDPERRLDGERAEWMLRAYLETGRMPDREPRRSRRGVLVAVLLVAAMAGAGVSGAALIMHQEGGGGTPSPSPPSVSGSVSGSVSVPTDASTRASTGGPTSASTGGPTSASTGASVSSSMSASSPAKPAPTPTGRPNGR